MHDVALRWPIAMQLEIETAAAFYHSNGVDYFEAMVLGFVQAYSMDDNGVPSNPMAALVDRIVEDETSRSRHHR